MLSLYPDEDGSVVPFIMIEAGYVPTETEPVRGRACYVEAQWPPRLSGTIIRSNCTMFVIDDESGKCLHLGSHLSNVRLSSTITASSGGIEASKTCLGSTQRVTCLSCAFRMGAFQHLFVASILSGLTQRDQIGMR